MSGGGTSRPDERLESAPAATCALGPRHAAAALELVCRADARSMPLTSCPSAQTLTLFLRGKKAGSRDEIELHLSHCRSCRQRVVSLFDGASGSVGASVPSVGTAARGTFQGRRMVVVSGIGLAAAVTLVAGLVYWGSDSGILNSRQAVSQGEVFRQGAPTVALPRLLGPAEGAVLPRRAVGLKWQPVADATSYTVTFTDATGTIIARPTTSESEISVELSTSPWRPGKSYYWYVSARLADGSLRESDPRGFAVAPEG